MGEQRIVAEAIEVDERHPDDMSYPEIKKAYLKIANVIATAAGRGKG